MGVICTPPCFAYRQSGMDLFILMVEKTGYAALRLQLM